MPSGTADSGNAAVPSSAHRLADLIVRFGGHALGDTDRAIAHVAPLEHAGPLDLAFLSNVRYRPQLASTRAACVLLSASDAAELDAPARTTLWVHANPYAQFARVAQLFAQENASPVVPGVHASAVIAQGARIAATASIGAHVVIEEGASIGAYAVIGAGAYVGAGASIGDHTLLYPRVTIYHACSIGARGIVHAGVVIGADGFGFAPDEAGYVKIPQSGAVRIGDDVEIGANTTIDRGTMSDTVIEDGVKLDNQIQIAHNVSIGAHTVMAGCSAVAGSTSIGKRCMIGGAAMIIGHLTITDHVVISVGTVVSHSIHKPGFYTGFYPMAENADWEKSAALVRQLERLRARIKALEQHSKNPQGES